MSEFVYMCALRVRLYVIAHVCMYAHVTARGRVCVFEVI